jgi:hypothetical protein
MPKRFVATLLALWLCVSCTGLMRPNPPATETPADQNTVVDYAVYKALIEAMYAGENQGMVVIQDHTTSSLVLAGSDAAAFETIQKAMPEVDQAMQDSYLARNAQSVLLQDHFNLKIPVTLLNQADFDSFFGPSGKGWDNFYVQYSKSGGLLTLSRVGYNAPGDKALVCASTQVYALAGAGYAVVLSLENGLWKVVNQVMLWTS